MLFINSRRRLTLVKLSGMAQTNALGRIWSKGRALLRRADPLVKV